MNYKQKYCERMKEALYWAKIRGARVNDAVLFAQGALESNWGQSVLAKEANNLFGIKAGKTWNGGTIELPTTEFRWQKGYYKTIGKWRKYRSWQECILDYSCLLKDLPWFQDALQCLDNADKFLEAILPTEGEPGWATDNKYKEKVREIGREIEKMGYIKWQ